MTAALAKLLNDNRNQELGAHQFSDRATLDTFDGQNRLGGFPT
jgi:hypothetical protein